MTNIGIDIFGGDHAPGEILKAVKLFLEKKTNVKLTLFGSEKVIKAALGDIANIEIVHTEKFLSMGEKDPVSYLRANPDCSMALALHYAKEKKIDGVVSAGPTQALIVGAHLIVKRLENMKRTALCPILPSEDGKGKLLLDVGANLELKKEHMLELANFATILSREVMGIAEPITGLLNIGTEAGKGRDIDKETYALLETSETINFYGNIETKELFSSPCHIHLTDGYTGNMVLKTMEGVFGTTGKLMREEIKRTFMGKLGYFFMRKNLARFKKRLDPKEIGGAMLIGVNAPVIKAHGSSDAYAFYNAIQQAEKMISNDVIEKVKKVLSAKEE